MARIQHQQGHHAAAVATLLQLGADTPQALPLAAPLLVQAGQAAEQSGAVLRALHLVVQLRAEERGDEGVFVRKVSIDRADADARLTSDLLEGDVEPALGEEPLEAPRAAR